MYPKKFVVINVIQQKVIGMVITYSEAGSANPGPGEVAVEVGINTPYDSGWGAILDDETQQWVFTAPRVVAATASDEAGTQGTGAGGGEQRPPQ